MSEPTYEVAGGQGHMIIARRLSYNEAVKFARQFDRECAAAGLFNPPTLIQKEQRR